MEKLDKNLNIRNKNPGNIATDVTIIESDNNSSLVDKFHDRFFYRISGVPILLPEGFDFNKTGFYYGKVDTQGRVIVPKEESLVLVNSKFTGGEAVFLNKDLYSLYLDFYNKTKIDFAVSKLNIDVFTEVFKIQKGASPYGLVDQNYKEDISEKIKNIFLKQIIEKNSSIKDTADNFNAALYE